VDMRTHDRINTLQKRGNSTSTLHARRAADRRLAGRAADLLETIEAHERIARLGVHGPEREREGIAVARAPGASRAVGRPPRAVGPALAGSRAGAVGVDVGPRPDAHGVPAVLADVDLVVEVGPGG